MHHIFKQGTQEPVFVLLHGTGGDENSLLEIGEMLNEKASILSIRGNVLEGGMLRFFRRVTEGVYDEADLTLRGNELRAFIKEAATNYHFDLGQVILVGYSNGANIAMQLLLHEPEIFQKAILFHPMFPVENLPIYSLEKTQIFTTLGEQDPIVSISDSLHVIKVLEERHAMVTKVWTANHQLTYQEILAANQWLE